MDNRAPKKIYLLWHGESPEGSGEGIFWNEDRINDTDEEYYHVSEIEQLEKEKEWLIHHYAKDMIIDNDRLDNHGIDDFKKEIIEEMQQALLEESE